MRAYLDLMDKVLNEGESRTDRTGTGTISIFGHQSRYDLKKGFPLITTKKCHLRSIIHELLWFLTGDTNIAYLKKHKVKIWDAWAAEDGSLGPVYGSQWRAWKDDQGREHDQIQELINGIKKDPGSRRLIINAWNVGQLDQMALPPCHAFVQFYVSDKGLSCQLYQRSADIFLGVPFNIASYALLTMMVAQVCNLEVHEFIHTIGDAHIYTNHLEQCSEQLSRLPKQLPQMKLNKEIKNIFDFGISDFELIDYDAHPHIKGAVSV